jgi:hypothetical protein
MPEGRGTHALCGQAFAKTVRWIGRWLRGCGSPRAARSSPHRRGGGLLISRRLPTVLLSGQSGVGGQASRPNLRSDLMKNSVAPVLIGFAVLAAGGAMSADICKKDAATGPVSYCAASIFSDGIKGEYNAQLGPGNALSGQGIPGTNTAGDIISGTFSCPGSNFFVIHDTSNQGDSNVIYGRFSTTHPAASHGFDSFNGLVFSTSLTPGSCAPPRPSSAIEHRRPTVR